MIKAQDAVALATPYSENQVEATIRALATEGRSECRFYAKKLSPKIVATLLSRDFELRHEGDEIVVSW